MLSANQRLPPSLETGMSVKSQTRFFLLESAKRVAFILYIFNILLRFMILKDFYLHLSDQDCPEIKGFFWKCGKSVLILQPKSKTIK